jgi:hypothetical protein
MTVRIQPDNLPFFQVIDQVHRYFEGAVNGRANSLDQLYVLGMARLPADEYLWKFTDKLLSPVFDLDEINKLREENEKIQGAAYPLNLKMAFRSFLEELQRIFAEQRIQKISNSTLKQSQNQAIRNVYELKTGQSAQPGHGPANSMRKFLGIQPPKGSQGGSRKKLRKVKKTRKLKKKSHTRKRN